MQVNMQAMLKADDTYFRFVVALEGSWDGALDPGDLTPLNSKLVYSIFKLPFPGLADSAVLLLPLLLSPPPPGY